MARRVNQIESVVLTWEGVESVPHQFGGREFRAGRRELGHLHGERLLDLPFQVRIRERLVREGRAEPHHILPETGWVSFHIRQSSDVARAIELLRLNFDRPWLNEPERKDEVDEASDESFPASDPPAFVSSTGSHPLPAVRQAS